MLPGGFHSIDAYSFWTSLHIRLRSMPLVVDVSTAALTSGWQIHHTVLYNAPAKVLPEAAQPVHDTNWLSQSDWICFSSHMFHSILGHRMDTMFRKLSNRVHLAFCKPW